MELLAVIGLLIVGVTLLFWWRDVNALADLKHGRHGPFKVTHISGGGTAQLAIDTDAKKIALVGVGVPQFNGCGNVTHFVDMTVVFSYDDITHVNITVKDEVAQVAFFFNKPIPQWNKLQELSFTTDESVRAFFQRSLQEVSVLCYRSNKYGGVDRVT